LFLIFRCCATFLTVNFSDPAIKARVLSHGARASPGCAVGQLVFTVQQAIEKHAAGELCILVRPDTSVDDLEGLRVSYCCVLCSAG